MTDSNLRRPKRVRCVQECEDGKQCRKLARVDTELVTRLEALAGKPCYCPQHTAEWMEEDADDE